jgi:hypothetical protein
VFEIAGYLSWLKLNPISAAGALVNAARVLPDLTKKIMLARADAFRQREQQAEDYARARQQRKIQENPPPSPPSLARTRVKRRKVHQASDSEDPVVGAEQSHDGDSDTSTEVIRPKVKKEVPSTQAVPSQAGAAERTPSPRRKVPKTQGRAFGGPRMEELREKVKSKTFHMTDGLPESGITPAPPLPVVQRTPSPGPSSSPLSKDPAAVDNSTPPIKKWRKVIRSKRVPKAEEPEVIVISD